MPIPNWEDVTCSCGSKLYVESFTFRVHPTHGTSKGPEEIRCMMCQEPVDPAKDQKKIRIQQKLAELKELGYEPEKEEANNGATA